MKHDILLEDSTTPAKSQRMPLREGFLLITYHLRMLNWWLYLLMLLCFLGSGFIYWRMIYAGTPPALENGDRLSRFIMESGVGLIASALTSFLIVGDPLIELETTTREGIGKIFAWRYLLTLIMLALCASLYLAWTFYFHAHYAGQQNALYIALLSITPVLLMSMLALLGALLTRSATLGAILPAIPFIGELLMHDAMLDISWLHPFFIPYTYWMHDAPDWWLNRITLLTIGLLLAIICWFILRYREDKLLNSQQ